MWISQKYTYVSALLKGFPDSSVDKESARNAANLGSPSPPAWGLKKIPLYNKQSWFFSSPLEPSLLSRTPQVQLLQHLSHSPERLTGRKHNIQKTPEICIVVTNANVRGHSLLQSTLNAKCCEWMLRMGIETRKRGGAGRLVEWGMQ